MGRGARGRVRGLPLLFRVSSWRPGLVSPALGFREFPGDAGENWGAVAGGGQLGCPCPGMLGVGWGAGGGPGQLFSNSNETESEPHPAWPGWGPPRPAGPWRLGGEGGVPRGRTHGAVSQAPVLRPPPPLLRRSSPPLGTRGVFWGHSPALLFFLAAVALSHRAPSSAARTTPARVRARPRGLRWRRVPAPACHETCSARGSAGGGRRGDRAVGAGVRGGGQACAHRLVSDSCLVRGRCIVFSR